MQIYQLAIQLLGVIASANSWCLTVFQKMFQSFDELMRRGSNWTLKKVNNMEIHSASYKAIGGKAHFPLPRALAVSKAVINV